ncbi:MAG: hypothetical protein M3357_08685, partial [Actinomycetota bacterium]|nr:hypothetical protein [Actinomycetota bacterium]
MTATRTLHHGRAAGDLPARRRLRLQSLSTAGAAADIAAFFGFVIAARLAQQSRPDAATTLAGVTLVVMAGARAWAG